MKRPGAKFEKVYYESEPSTLENPSEDTALRERQLVATSWRRSAMGRSQPLNQAEYAPGTTYLIPYRHHGWMKAIGPICEPTHAFRWGSERSLAQ